MRGTLVVLVLLGLLIVGGCAKKEAPPEPPPADPEREAELDAYAREAAELAAGRKAAEQKRARDAKARAAAQAPPQQGPATVRGADVAPFVTDPMQASAEASKQLRESSPEWRKMVMDRYRPLMSRPGIDEISLKGGSGLYIGYTQPQPNSAYEQLARDTAADFARFKEQKLGASRSVVKVIVCEGRAWEENAVVSVKASANGVEEPVWHR